MVKGTISPQVAFRTLTQVRKERSAAENKWGTFRILKDGSVAKTVTTIHLTRKEAETNTKYLAKINPGNKWIVKRI